MQTNPRDPNGDGAPPGGPPRAFSVHIDDSGTALIEPDGPVG